MSEGLGPPIEREAEAATGSNRERAAKPASVKRKSRKHGPSGFPLEKHEHYVEELWVSRRLFETRDFGTAIVDPCAGFGGIVMSAMAMGLRAWGGDLVARAPWIAGGRDFLKPSWRAPAAFRGASIVCNPPFGGRDPLIRQFAETALKRAPKVALLMPIARIAAAGAWLEATPLVETLYVSPRSSLWPGRIYAERLKQGLPLKNGFADCAWLIFEKGAPPGASRNGWLRRDA